ncbi:ribose-phosphate diphosphokinase [Diplocarpon rosae]|nr:ribose-phosphate diphosphokinase [Diplocarpon rosae]
MRNTLIFAGSSCPGLTNQICSNLGMAPAAVELSQFANGETSVKILTSIREKDVFVVQSGSSKINDSIMELLILISACKGGSANKITAVLPYFPYSRQSKKKSHRGAITARMLANLLNVAGINHVLNFGMVTTDKRRGGGMTTSMIMSRLDVLDNDPDVDVSRLEIDDNDEPEFKTEKRPEPSKIQTSREEQNSEQSARSCTSPPRRTVHSRQDSQQSSRKPQTAPSPLRSAHKGPVATRSPLTHPASTPAKSSSIEEEVGEGDEAEFTDERARDIIHGRLIHGHIVPDDYPSPTQSAMSNSVILERSEDEPMEISRNSSFFNPEAHVLGGTADAAATSDEEEEGFNNPSLEQMITLVGDVRGRTVFIVDDMIDKAGSWIAAAECVVKRGGAKKVYCIATHGLFGGDSLEELENCDCIDLIVVTNSFPIPPEKARGINKLVVLDLSNLLAEAIRRNHYGESISALFSHSHD